MGTLGDRVGRRRLLLIGGTLFAIASIVAAFSTSTEMLIASRALMGVAGATLSPSTLALISNMFRDPRQMGTAIGVWVSCFMGGMALGPIVGGAMLEFFWWGSVFLPAVPVMLLLLVLGPVLLPEYKTPEAGKLDPLSVALSLGAILPVVYGVKEIAKDGVGVVSNLAIVLGVVLGVVFVLRQRGLDRPLMDLRLFGNRSFAGALVIEFRRPHDGPSLCRCPQRMARRPGRLPVPGRQPRPPEALERPRHHAGPGVPRAAATAHAVRATTS